MAPPNHCRSPLDRRLVRLLLGQRRVGGGLFGQPAHDEVELDVIGFSHHSVPSLSNTATRASGATKSGPPSAVTRPTKSTIADFVGPSVQDGEFCHAQPPRVERNLLSSSTAWLIVNVAGSWRGGNSLNVSRNCVAIAEP